MKLIREFTCSLTGDECAIVLNAVNDEICILKSEYLEILSNIAHDEHVLSIEIG